LTVWPDPPRTQLWRGGRVFRGLGLGGRLPRFVLEKNSLGLRLLRVLSRLLLPRLARLDELLLLGGAHHEQLCLRPVASLEVVKQPAAPRLLVASHLLVGRGGFSPEGRSAGELRGA